MVAHAAIEGGHRAIFVAANLSRDDGVGNDFARKFDAILRLRSAHFWLAAADRRKEADFVATGKRGIPRREFAIARGY